MRMKKTFLLILICMFAGALSGYAQLSKDQMKERKEITKSTKSQLNEKATKVARKEAKNLIKEGWKSSAGALPIDKLLARSYLIQYEYDEDMYPKYIMGEAMSIGTNYDGARMQALELAKQNLAGQIQTEVTALVENTVANEQLKAEEAETITRSVMAAKNLISQSLGRTISVMELCRTLPNKNKEVLVRIAYSGNAAKKIARDAIKKNLEEHGDNLHDKLDQLLGW